MPFVLLYLVVEIVALVALASWIGVGCTLLVLLAGSVVGLWLARREGLRAVRAMAEAARDHRVAHVELTDGLLVAMGGLLLLVPGLVTDVAGLLLLLPPTRSLVRRRMVREAERRSPVLRTARIRGDGSIVDGDGRRRSSTARVAYPRRRVPRSPRSSRAGSSRVSWARAPSSRGRSSTAPTWTAAAPPDPRPQADQVNNSQLVAQRTVTRTGSGSRPSSRTSGAASRPMAAIAKARGSMPPPATSDSRSSAPSRPVERGGVALGPVAGVRHRAGLGGATRRGRVGELPVRPIQRRRFARHQRRRAPRRARRRRRAAA